MKAAASTVATIMLTALQIGHRALGAITQASQAVAALATGA
jgi:hypothetical protein